MKPLHSTQDFLDLAAAGASSAAASRACREGNYSTPRRVTLPGDLVGWEFEVWSQRGTQWTFTIALDETNRRYQVCSRLVPKDT